MKMSKSTSKVQSVCIFVMLSTILVTVAGSAMAVTEYPFDYTITATGTEDVWDWIPSESVSWSHMHRGYCAEVRWEWVDLDGSWYEVCYQPVYGDRIQMEYRFTKGKFEQVYLPFINETWVIDIKYFDNPGGETHFTARKWGIVRIPWSDEESGSSSVSVTDGVKYITTSILVAPNGDTIWSVEDNNPQVETWMKYNKLYASVIPGAIDGYVTDCQTSEPIEGAFVIAIGKLEKKWTFSNSNGYYELADLPEGTYLVIGVKRGYRLHVAWVEVKAAETTEHEFCLNPK